MNTTSRRNILTGFGSMAALGSIRADEAATPIARKGNIKQVIAAWPFMKGAGWTHAQLIQHAQNLGVAGVELFSAEELPLLKGTGLVVIALGCKKCRRRAMLVFGGIVFRS